MTNEPIAENLTSNRYLWYLFNIIPAIIDEHTPTIITTAPSIDI